MLSLGSMYNLPWEKKGGAGVFEIERTESHISIVRYTGSEKRVEVPAEIEGLEVTMVGDYAFSKTPLTHLSLPRTVSRIGRYAFYACHELCELSFTDSLKDIGAGAFTGCHHIRQLRLYLTKGEVSVLRDVLMELSEELTVSIHSPEGEGCFLFPEFFEEGIENTPARIIDHDTHGSGLLFRNCFVSRRLQIAEYDKRFADARGEEGEELLIRLCLTRLRYPLRLEEGARKVYETYLAEHLETALDLYGKRKDARAMAFLMDWKRKRQPARRAAMDFEL